MPGFNPIGVAPIGSLSSPSGQTAPTITQRPLTRCCCPDCDCCGACQDVSPCAFSVQIDGKWYYLRPHTVAVENNGTCIYRWTGSVGLGDGTITQIQLLLWNQSDPTEPHSIRLTAEEGGRPAQIWEKFFGLSKIDCSRSYTLPETQEEFGTFGEAEIVPVKVRSCCCSNCGSEGTPGSVSIAIPDGAGGTLTITATRPRYGDTSIMYCDRFTARIEPITLYGATDLTDVLVGFIANGPNSIIISSPTTGDQVTWWHIGAWGSGDCSTVRTLTPGIATFTPPGDAIVTPSDLKICDSPICCTSACGTFTPQQWVVTLDVSSFEQTVYIEPDGCTWSTTFERQLVGSCYADTLTLTATFVGGPPGVTNYDLTLSDSTTATTQGTWTYASGVPTTTPPAAECSASKTLTRSGGSCAGLATSTATIEPARLHACGSTVFCSLPCELADEYSIVIDGFSDANFTYETIPCDDFTQEEYHCPKCSTYNGEWFGYRDTSAPTMSSCGSVTAAAGYFSDRTLHCHRVITQYQAGGGFGGCGIDQEYDCYSSARLCIFCDSPSGLYLTLRATLFLCDGGAQQQTVWSLQVLKADFDCTAPYDLVFDSSLSSSDGCAEGQDTPPTCTVTPLPL